MSNKVKGKAATAKEGFAWIFLWFGAGCLGSGGAMIFSWGAFYPSYLNINALYGAIFFLALGMIFGIVSVWLKFKGDRRNE